MEEDESLLDEEDSSDEELCSCELEDDVSLMEEEYLGSSLEEIELISSGLFTEFDELSSPQPAIRNAEKNSRKNNLLFMFQNIENC